VNKYKDYLDIDDLLYFPYLDAKADEDADFDDKVRLVVHHVKKDDHGLEDIEEHGANRETFEGFTITPELDICNQYSTRNYDYARAGYLLSIHYKDLRLCQNWISVINTVQGFTITPELDICSE